MTKISDARLADAEWLEQVALYFEKRDTGGEDMAFWANVMNAERCRSIAQSLRAQGGVRVKALEWREEGKGWFRAPSEMGAYNITHYAGMKSEGFKLEYGGGFTSYFSSLEKAKAAAQADYERRVLSSLEASPAPVSEEMVHDAQFLIERLDDFERGSLGDTIEDACRDFDGHVSPAIERLRAALAEKGGQ